MSKHPSNQSAPMATATTTLLLLLTLLSSTTTTADALILPNLIGAISQRHRFSHAATPQRRSHPRSRGRSGGGGSSSSSSRGPSASTNGGNQMHSITLTIDDEDPSGLWNVMSRSSRSKRHPTARQRQEPQQEQRRLIRFGFHFFRGNNDSAAKNHHHQRMSAAAIQQQVQQSLRPYGPAPRGGSLEDVILLPSSSSSAAAALAIQPPSSSSSASSNDHNEQHRGLWSNVRGAMRGIRRTVISSAVSTFIHDHDANHHHNSGDLRVISNNNNNSNNNGEEMKMMFINPFERHGDGAAVNNMSVLRVGGMINRHLKSRRQSKLQSSSSSSSVVEMSEVVGVVTATARGGDASTVSSLSRSSSSSAVVSSKTRSTSSSVSEETTFIIDTPLFPIILPKSWEAPFKGTSSYSKTFSSTTTTTTTSSSYIESLEITIAPPEDTTTTVGTNKPTSQQLQHATLPLIPKSSWESFTGNEFFHPETYDGLVSTGVLMASTPLSEEYVTWSGDKKTDKFIKDQSSSSSWYEALDSSQDVLVWSGKCIGGGSGELYGAELPIIKTTSIIHKSPKYLAELLMDSTKVKAYNKMSLGREDVEVFQNGVDTTVEEGKFGNVGESKIVRNLTRPPMVNSNLEFVTCMHARKLSEQDLQTLASNNNDPNQPTNGYIVVSRAVTGGQWNSDESGNVRNEIILGVNILREVPNAPDKTELIAVTHVYSPMIPLMLAKNAGVKGAVDFVRDIRSLP